jgi:hypothetical protein
MRATKEVPIVIAATADPVGSGLVASLARPAETLRTQSRLAGHRGQAAATAAGVDSHREPHCSPDHGYRHAGENNPLVEQLQSAAKQLRLELAIQAIRSGTDIR